MSGIHWDGARVVVDLDDSWRRLMEELLALLPALQSDASVSARLNPAAHRDDPSREEAYRRAVDDELLAAREQDRSAVASSIWAQSLDVSVAESWMRVVGEMRLTLATKHGVDEASLNRAGDAPIRLIHMLGHVQDRLVSAIGRAVFQAE